MWVITRIEAVVEMELLVGYMALKVVQSALQAL